MTAPQPPAPRSVAWVASSFGFGDDLAYFRPIFEGLSMRIPGFFVTVRHDFPTHRYPSLDLRPVLTFWTFRTKARLRSGAVYDGFRRVPTLTTIVGLWCQRPDITLIAEFTPTALLGWTLTRVRRRPAVLLVESDPRLRGGRVGGIAGGLKSFVARHVETVLTSNAAGEAYCLAELRVPPHRLRTGPYLTSAPTSSLPADAPRDSDPVRLLFVNSLTERKGVSELFSALTVLSARGVRGWHLDVVGDGPLADRLRAHVDEGGIADLVTFHGRVGYDEVGAHYGKAHVVVCPSLGDYRSLAGFEALNARRPVIVSTLDGAHEELEQASPLAVRVVDPRDATALVNLIESAVTDRASLAMALTAAATPPAQFTIAAVVGNVSSAVAAAWSAERRRS